MVGSMRGFVVGVTADRRAEEQIELLERRGATVVHARLIRTRPFDAEGALHEATVEVVDRPPDYVIASTGIGIRSWLSAAEAWGLDTALVETLAGSRVAARGPKVAGALATAGIPVWWRAPGETFAEVVARLAEEDLKGRRVVVQQHGRPVPEALDTVRDAGAEVIEIPVYRWDVPEDLRPARRLVAAACDGRIDALTFTSTPALQNFVAVADAEEGLAGLRRKVAQGELVFACVGPVCGEAARRAGFEDVVLPPAARLGSMVRSLDARLAGGRTEISIEQHVLSAQGRVLVRGDLEVELTAKERALWGVLSARSGRVAGRAELMRAGWAGQHPDDHRLEVTVARLRTKLRRVRVRLVTVPKRGYRLEDLTAPQVRGEVADPNV
jgi:uroporphyrinogen-III synthase